MTKEEMIIASALLWQMSWPIAVTNIRGKRKSSSFVNPLKRTSTICPSYMRKNRVQLYDFSANETKIKNSTRSGKQSSDDETNSEANLSGYDLSLIHI